MRALSSEQKSRICRVWVERTLAAHSEEFARFATDNRDAFSNPVGEIVRTGLGELFDALLDGADTDRFRAALEQVIRLKAVQDQPASQALAFIPLLKDLVRDQFPKDKQDKKAREALAVFEGRIDQALLVAFDLYTECRERIFQLRVNELKRSTAGLLRQSGKLRPTAAEAVDGSCPAACESEEGCRP